MNLNMDDSIKRRTAKRKTACWSYVPEKYQSLLDG